MYGEGRLNLDNSSLNRCPKPYWQAAHTFFWSVPKSADVLVRESGQVYCKSNITFNKLQDNETVSILESPQITPHPEGYSQCSGEWFALSLTHWWCAKWMQLLDYLYSNSSLLGPTLNICIMEHTSFSLMTNPCLLPCPAPTDNFPTELNRCSLIASSKGFPSSALSFCW